MRIDEFAIDEQLQPGKQEISQLSALTYVLLYVSVPSESHRRWTANGLIAF
jgi:hypothetical protein